MSGSEYTTTPNLGLYKPLYNADAEQWGNHLNLNADLLDATAGSVINVLAFGAKGDGVTNDTAAIQSVLDIYAGKATVFIPDTGQPYMVNTLQPPTGTDLLIHGTLKLRPASTIGVIFVNNVSNITIRGHGVLDGNGPAQTGTEIASLNANQASNLHVSGITIKNALNWNVNIASSSHARLNAVSLIGGANSNEFAGKFSGGGDSGCDDCWIVNSYIDGPSNDSGFTFYGGITNSGMANCTVKNSFVSAVGVYADPGSPLPCGHISITDNIFLNNTQYCIFVTVSGVSVTHSDIIITNNICRDNGYSSTAPFGAIWMDHCDTISVSGNLIDTFGTNAAQTYGIYLGANAANSHVMGNTIARIGNGGPNAAGLGMNGANYALITGNYLAGMATAITGFIGNACVITGNRCDAQISGITPQPDTILDNTVNGRRIMSNLPTAATGLPTGAVWRNGTVLNIV